MFFKVGEFVGFETESISVPVIWLTSLWGVVSIPLNYTNLLG